MLLGKLKSNKRLTKIVIYSLPSYVSSLVGLFTFPLVANFLTVEDYGRLDLLLLIVMILNVSLHCGWGGAHNRLYFEPGVVVDNLVKSILCMRVSVYVALSIFTFFLIDNIASWVHVNPLHVQVVLIGFVASDLLMFFQYRYRMRNEGGRYLTLFIIKPVVYLVSLTVILLANKLTVINVLLCVLLSNVVPLVFGILFDGRWCFIGRLEFLLLKRVLRFGLPLFPASLAVLALNSVDRLMLNSLVVDAELALLMLGLFAVANRLVSILGLATNGFTMLWGPYVMKTFREVGIDRRYRSIYSMYLFFAFFLSVVVITGAHFCIPMLMPTYNDSLMILHLLMASSLLYSVGAYFCIGIGISEKTEYKAYVGVVALCVNVGLNYLLIPMYGLIGAGTATYLSMFLYVFLLMFLSERFYKVGYSRIALAGCSMVIAVSSLIDEFIVIFLLNLVSVCLLFLFSQSELYNAFKWLFKKQSQIL